MDEFDVAALHYSQDNIDRLSELPDLLLLVILSLLPMREVVRTTILSKRWKNLWISVPCLDFWYESSRDFICGALAQWNGAKIHKFSLRFFFYYLPRPNDLQSWLLFAIEKRVEELLVESIYNGYRAPQRLYSCSSITKLSLSFCKLKIEENVIVQWNQLKSLTIEHSKPMRADVMTKVLSGAPVLEELILCFREIKENLDIRSTSLKMLHIGRYDKPRFSARVRNAVLTIQAPNLLSLEISASFYGDNCLLDVPSLANAILHFEMDVFDVDYVDRFPHLEMFNGVFRSICHVEKVTLSAWCTEFLVDLKKKDMAVPFSNAKFLQLYASTAEEILHVLEMFPMLMMLNVTCDNRELIEEPITAEEIQAAMVDACNSSVHKMTSLPTPSLVQLKTVEITWSVDDASIIPMTEILLENAHLLEKMALHMFITSLETYTLVEEKVLSMPRSSPDAQVITSKKGIIICRGGKF